jgi:micrococcal nuclease
LRRRAARWLIVAAAFGTAAAVVAFHEVLTDDPPDVGSAGGGAVVSRVVDGDTLRVTVDGRDVTVRLLGVDAPEMPDGCGAKEATAALETLLPVGTPVTLTVDPEADDMDRWGRWLRYLDVAGVDAAESLSRAGLVGAWFPKGEPEPERYPVYEAAVSAARSERVGSWAECPGLGR